MLSEYPDIINVREAMDLLGISRNMLYDLIRNNTIHAFKLGNRIWRIKKSDSK